ncbi:hypothetical protein ACTD5D_22130 [Nocardia takedensis]|uniref:hypothetical protein n=1 Tax=Nocardia takedensis TaxID=259390 RepID=UPI003F764EE3
MITIPDLRTWISGLDPFGHVGIDEGGLWLVEIPHDDRTTGAHLEVGGYDEDRDPPAPQAATTVVSPPAEATVVSVADLLGMVGGNLTRDELPLVRAAIRRSSIGAALGDVVFSVIAARRCELSARLRPFTDPETFTGGLGRGLLSAVPGRRIAGLFAEIEAATGLSLVRVCFGAAARLCVHDRDTGRLFDLGEDFELWLHGDRPGPGSTQLWIGVPVDDFTRDELSPTGPHDYRLPEPSPDQD